MNVPQSESCGDRIVLQFDSLEDARRLFTPWRDAVPCARAARKIHRALIRAGMALDVQVNGRCVAALGQSAIDNSSIARPDRVA